MKNKQKEFIDMLIRKGIILLVLGLLSGFVMISAFTFKWLFGGR